MEVRLFVIRHGETDWNSENRINGHFNSPLTLTGARESVRAGTYLRSLGLHKVYVSSLPRTLQTLQYLQLSCRDVVVEPRLRDRDFGPYNGQLYASYVQAKHEEKQRLLTGCCEVDGEYLVPRAGSSCVVTNSGVMTRAGLGKPGVMARAGLGKPCVMTRAGLGKPGVVARAGLGKPGVVARAGLGKHSGGYKQSLVPRNEYSKRMVNEIEPAGVERYEQLYSRIGALIQHVVQEACAAHCAAHPGAPGPVNVLFVTHCSPTRMVAMVLSSYLDTKLPLDLRKCDVPNNSISEFRILANKENCIDEVQLVRLASTKHLYEY